MKHRLRPAVAEIFAKTRARGRAIINGNLFAAVSVWYFYFKPNVAAHFAGWGTDDLTAGRAVATTYFIEK